jgi:hypothetical protein
MVWPEVLLALVRCELKAQYSCLGGWQVSAKGALPVVLVAAGFLLAWMQK